MKLTLLSMVALMGSQMNFCDAIRLAGNSIATEDAALAQTLAQIEGPPDFPTPPGNSNKGLNNRCFHRGNSNN